MKRVISLLTVIMVLFAMSYAFADDSNKTTMDQYHFGSKELPKINNPYYKVSHELEEIEKNQDYALELLAQTWYDLLDYEVNTLGNKVNDTFAADIYKGIKSKLCAAIISATDKDAVCLNVFFASTDKQFTYVYWLEWNLEDQTIRYMDGTSDGHKKAAELFDDYMLSSWAAATIQTSWFESNPDAIILKYMGSNNEMLKIYEKAYSDANNGAKISIK